MFSDGGVAGLNNPSRLGMAEVVHGLVQDYPSRTRLDMVLSVGSGFLDNADFRAKVSDDIKHSSTSSNSQPSSPPYP